MIRNTEQAVKWINYYKGLRKKIASFPAYKGLGNYTAITFFCVSISYFYLAGLCFGAISDWLMPFHVEPNLLLLRIINTPTGLYWTED